MFRDGITILGRNGTIGSGIIASLSPGGARLWHVLCSRDPVMTPPAQSHVESAPAPAPAAPVRVIVPVPPEPRGAETSDVPAPTPALYASGGEIILEHGAPLPVGTCVKCGRPACGAWTLALRNPRFPGAWYGARPVLEMGLCRKHRDDRSVAVALTWSFLSIGTLLVVVGSLTFTWVSALVGLFAMGGAGWFRAASPMVATLVTGNRIVLAGAGAAFLRQLRSGDRE